MHIKLFLAFFLLFIVFGCATTGDPTKGGLFGWSEEKAKVRRTELEREANEARVRAREAKENQSNLNEREKGLDFQVKTLNNQLTRLMQENAALREEFEELMQQNNTLTEELTALQNELRQTQEEWSTPPPMSFSEVQAQKVRQQNKRLNAAILLLLSQR